MRILFSHKPNVWVRFSGNTQSNMQQEARHLLLFVKRERYTPIRHGIEPIDANTTENKGNKRAKECQKRKIIHTFDESISQDCFVAYTALMGAERTECRKGMPVSCMYCSTHLVPSVLPRNKVFTSPVKREKENCSVLLVQRFAPFH